MLTLSLPPHPLAIDSLGVILSGLGITGAIFGGAFHSCSRLSIPLTKSTVSCAQLIQYARRYWKQDRVLLKTIVRTPYVSRFSWIEDAYHKVTSVWTLDALHLGLYSYTSTYSIYPSLRSPILNCVQYIIS